MLKEIAGLVLRPVPSAESGRVTLRFLVAKHRRESRPASVPAGTDARREAEDLFCQLAHDWLFAIEARHIEPCEDDDLSPEAAVARFTATAARVRAQLPVAADYMTVLIEAQLYGTEQGEWARWCSHPLVIEQGDRFARNPPPRRLDVLNRSSAALWRLQNAVAHQRESPHA